MLETGSGPSQECSAWVGWAGMVLAGMVSAGMVSSRLSGFTSGRSFADDEGLQVPDGPVPAHPLSRLLSPWESSRFCRQETLSPADPTGS